jgi:hypothetical protein
VVDWILHGCLACLPCLYCGAVVLKPQLYEAIMQLEEGVIRELFPIGATQEGNRWTPAEKKSKATKTLAGRIF